MPHRDVVYRKSARGAEAIAARDHALTHKLRSLLILVDGKRSYDDLARLSTGLGDPDQLLGQLLEQGYIEAAETTAASTPPHPPPAAAATGQHPPVTLREAQRFAVRRLTDILGPAGETLCLRIEGAHNVNEFQQVIRRAEMVLRDFGGEKLARSFADEMQAHWPSN